ncbi:MAG: ClC family H(+)/Cl(-) exchange transporter [Mobilibacterium timonense]|uniref:ClC family H(+)/Cl(-) exchange transporter n=2 Tax=Mobilibacterium timonense TaxID=1871012 RepID=UPI002356965C|nr:chloride channel protein [Mobilibacterium timonense]MBM6991603.1 ClC family H(+)/Cl(-) exchange transporter [Mobilibacterium timonense]
MTEKNTGKNTGKNKAEGARYRVRNVARREHFQRRMILEGALVGGVTGTVIALFRLALNNGDVIRNRMVEFARTGGSHSLVVLGILMVLAVLIYLLLRWAPDISGSGIPQVEGEMKGLEDQCWWRVLPAKLLGCTLAIGGGLALGREGPSIQIGGMLGKACARIRKTNLTEERLLMTCGAGAGLAAAFGAPLAGALFSLEELHKNFSLEVLVPTMVSTAVADYVAVNIIGLTPVFDFSITEKLPLRLYWSVLALGLILGAFGVLYNRTLAAMQDLFDGIGRLVDKAVSSVFTSGDAAAGPSGRHGRDRKPLYKMIAAMLMAFAAMFLYPVVLGSGSYLVAMISAGRFTLGALAVMLIWKFFFSTASFGSGSPGGIFLPLLVLGALTGGLYSRGLSALLGVDQVYIASFVILGMAGYFAAIVRAPITGIILITEMTGDLSSFLSLTFISVVAYMVADTLGGEPVYEQLLNRRLEKRKLTPQEEDIVEIDRPRYQKERTVDKKTRGRERRAIIFGDIHTGSYMDGRQVMDLELPPGALITSVRRGDRELIPGGRTRLLGGDVIEVLCRRSDIGPAQDILEKKCHMLTGEEE